MKRDTGFSLLEVLITIVILAVGLLGLAGLTAASMRNSHGAYNRSQAVWLAYDIADRMRANRVNAQAGSYNIALTSTAPGGASISQTDLQQWVGAVSTLPGPGQGSVNYNAGTRQVTITVQWNETRAAGGATEAADATRQFVVQTQL